jgi:RHS repeat-associated protein
MTTATICATREVSWSLSFYRGEQYDPDLGLYYLRARYYDPLTGRFLSRDPNAGYIDLPKTLHKYLYAGGDPVNGFDPTGRASLVQYAFGITVPTSASFVLWAAAGACTVRGILLHYGLAHYTNAIGKAEDDATCYILGLLRILTGTIPGTP